MKAEHIIYFCITLTFVALAGTLLNISNKVSAEDHWRSYCQSVLAWEADRVRGVDVYDRKGHPNFNQVECD